MAGPSQYPVVNAAVHGKAVLNLAYLQVPGRLLVSCSEDGSVRISHAKDGKEKSMWKVDSGWLEGLAVTRDGRGIITGGKDGKLRILDAEKRELVGEWSSGHGAILSVALSPDEGLLATCHEEAIAVWKMSKPRRLKCSKRTGNATSKIKYSLKLEVKHTIRTLRDHAVCLAFSPDGKRLASGHANGSIRVFDADAGYRIPLHIEGHAHTVSSLLWSPDGSLLISGAHDHTIQRWDSQAGKPVGHLPAARARITSLALTPDGKKLASASHDGTVTFWDMDTGVPFVKRLLHARAVWAVAFSPSGEFLACGQDDGHVSIWRSPWWTEGGKGEKPILAEDSSPLAGGDLAPRITRHGDTMVASGRYAFVYRGILHGTNSQLEVAIKAIKTDGAELERKRKRLLREIKIISSLDHPNVLPFLGITTGFGQLPAIVSPWAEYGTLTSYLQISYRNLSSVDLLTMLSDVASAQQYLHSRSIVHGDLSGARGLYSLALTNSNVLIRSNKRAYISDFGLSALLSEFEGAYASSFPGGTLRWIAPELLDLQVPEDGKETLKVAPTKQSDVYSFGGIMLQILSGRVPYYYYPRDGQVVMAIATGRTPQRPCNPLVTDRRWSLIQRCWLSIGARPSSTEIAHFTELELAEDLASLTGSLRLG